VLNDRRTILNPGTSSQYYTATLMDGNDYFPFGAQMRGSVGALPKFRYGFNGKEADRNGEMGSLTHCIVF
jgi:hypothetical protein